MTNCPNKNDLKFKENEELFGEDGARVVWLKSGEKNPIPQEALKMLYPDMYIEPTGNYETMDFGDWAGKHEAEYEKRIDDFILNHPDKPINGGDSFNGFQDKVLSHFSDLLKNAPDNTLVVTHSSVLKLLNLFNDEGRPGNFRVNAKKYTEAETHTGDVEKFKGDNGQTIWVVRHGQTFDNVALNLRGPDTKLTDKGVKQAHETANELSKVSISQVYTSPLNRVLHTTDIILQKQPFEIPDSHSELTDILSKFVNSLQGEIRNIDQIVVKGKVYSANAVTNVLNRTIDVVEGRADKSILPEEVAHLFVEYLPDDSPLLNRMMKEITSWPIYDEVMEEYKSNDLYQNEDGSVNENKIAKEAIGKMVGKAITNKFDNQREKSVWQKLWDKLWSWIQSIIGQFRDQIESPFEEAASDILSGDTTKLSLDKKFNAAEDNGMYYFQLNKEETEYLDKVKNDPSYTEETLNTLERVHEQNHERLALDTEDGKHDYITLHKDPENTIRYTSNTTSINGVKELSDDAKRKGEFSRQWGNDADSIFRSIATGNSWEHIRDNVETKSFAPEIKQSVHDILKNALDNLIDTDKDGNKDLAVVQSILTYEPQNAQKYLAASADLIIITPTGSLKKIIDLKTSRKSLKLDQGKYKRGVGSWLPENERMSKNEEYALQLTNEQAMIQIAHPDIEIEDNTLGVYSLVWKTDPKDDSVLIGVTDGGLDDIKFDLARWTKLSGGAMIPPGPKWQIADDPTPEELKDALDEGHLTTEDYNNLIDNIEKKNVKLDNIIKGMIELSLTRTKTLLPEFSNSIANNFKKIAADIQELQTNGERTKAIVEYMNHIQRFTDLYSNYIKNPENFKDSSYYQLLQETVKMAESNLESVPESLVELLSPVQLGVYNKLRKSILKLKTDYVLFARRYNEEFVAPKFNINDIKDNSGKVIKTVQQQLDDILWSAENDISNTSLMGDAIKEMTVPILGQLALIVDKARLQATINSNKENDEISSYGVAFEKATGLKLSDKSASDFLFQLDTDGNRERWLNKIGDDYYDEKKRVDNLMNDPVTGEKMEFIPDVSDEVMAKMGNEKISQTEYNIRLDKLRKERREFYKPEYIHYDEPDELGNYSAPEQHEGVYHSLDSKYLSERKRVMKFSNKKWEPRRGISKNKEIIADFNKWLTKPINKEAVEGKSETDKWNEYWKDQVRQFRDKFEEFSEYLSMETVYNTQTRTYEPTGKMIKKNGYFPSSKYIHINEDKLGWNGMEMAPIKSLQSKQYNNLKNDQSVTGKAKFELYNNITNKLSDAVKRGGDQCEQWYNRGGLINLPSNFIKKAAKSGVMNQLGHNLAENFTAIPDGSSKVTDEFGVPRQELLVPHMSNPRNLVRIKELEDKLTDLEKRKAAGEYKGSKIDEYNKEQKELKLQLKSENHKNDVRDLEVNPIKLLSVFAVGAEKYAQLAAIEGQVLAIRDIIRQDITNEKGDVKQFYQLGNIGQRLTRIGANGEKEFVFRRKDETNSLKKVEDFVKMFYGETYTKDTIDVIADRIMNITSFGAMGFNYMGHFKNAILYQASNFRQNIAERFVTRKNYTSAQKEFFASFLPGMQTKLFEKKSGPFKAKSKMEWFMYNFGLDTDSQLKAQGKAGNKWIDKFYMGENFDIHWAQYTMQTAFFKDKMLLDKDGKELHDKNGNVISMYDAYQWDPNTGVSTLRPEAADTLEQQKLLVITAKDIQLKTQGNFDEMSKPMIKNYLLGRMLSQFHNFFKTAWNDRFDKKYSHATLGEIEGTWRSVVSWGQMMKEFEGHWYNNLKNGWNALSPMQRKNLKTDLAEIMMVGSFILIGGLIKSAAKNISAANDPRKKKFDNLLAYTMNAVGKEQGMLSPAGLFTGSLGDFINNPFAITPVLKGLYQAVEATVEFPFQDDAHRYYQRGIFRGNSKAAENWKKILPITKQLHRWANFIEQSELDPEFLNKN